MTGFRPESAAGPSGPFPIATALLLRFGIGLLSCSGVLMLRFTRLHVSPIAPWIDLFPMSADVELPYHWMLPDTAGRLERALHEFSPALAGGLLAALNAQRSEWVAMAPKSSVASVTWLGAPSLEQMLEGYATWHRGIISSDNWDGVRAVILHQRCLKGTARRAFPVGPVSPAPSFKPPPAGATEEEIAAGHENHEGTGFAGLFAAFPTSVFEAMARGLLGDLQPYH